MPPHKQPQRLEDLSVAKAAGMMSSSCIAFETKYGVHKWSSCQETEVKNLQRYLLSYIQPLFDQVFAEAKRIYFSTKRMPLEWEDMCQFSIDSHIPKDFRTILMLMMHDRITVLNIDDQFINHFIQKVVLSASQIGQLKNIVVLEILGVKLTDELLEGIGRVCKNVNTLKITFNVRHAKIESLSRLLNCGELRALTILFDAMMSDNWERHLASLLTGLPKLESFKCNLSSPHQLVDVLANLTSPSSLALIDPDFMTASNLARIIRTCPHVQHVNIAVEVGLQEHLDVLVILAASPWVLQSIQLLFGSFAQEMGRLLRPKGHSLIKLVLQDCQGGEITVQEISEIGTNCPRLEELTICKFGMPGLCPGPPDVPHSTKPHQPAMFRALRHLHLEAAASWDLRALLCALPHARQLSWLFVANAFRGVKVDPLSEILDMNPLPALTFLAIGAWRWIGRLDASAAVCRDSLQRLVEQTCPLLGALHLGIPLERDAQAYIGRLGVRVSEENLDFELTCVACADQSGIFSESPGTHDNIDWLFYSSS